MIDRADIEKRFGYHRPPDEQTQRNHEAVRDTLADLCEFLDGFVPAGREKSLCFTKLEEAMMWANAAIARDPYGQP